MPIILAVVRVDAQKVFHITAIIKKLPVWAPVALGITTAARPPNGCKRKGGGVSNVFGSPTG
jgi:hypothetical protein